MKLLGMNTFIEASLVTNGMVSKKVIAGAYGVSARSAEKYIASFIDKYPNVIQYNSSLHAWETVDYDSLDQGMSAMEAAHYIEALTLIYKNESPVMGLIECKLYESKEFRRDELVDKLGISLSTAKRAISKYLESGNLKRTPGNTYRPTFTYLPLFIKNTKEAKRFEDALDLILGA
ncbi:MULTISPECIES: hypothetical protein [Vibrio]|uniref:hypothetical protein n=1 Tax=Vibrio TaxID=662 RepID=UPI00078C789A|nr:MULTISPECIES: hypothetical protein [Vibrio]BAU70966.1 hypothetical protein [Vibrio sp. 04Ya108]BBM67776.1 hypothetical protein VA249_44220 [Vibrio alfacsensis]BCN26947.1 hypothetical protein VYA_41390 [Vibrio alfacsensis]